MECPIEGTQNMANKEAYESKNNKHNYCGFTFMATGHAATR